jgi:hypothetical protein
MYPSINSSLLKNPKNYKFLVTTIIVLVEHMKCLRQLIDLLLRTHLAHDVGHQSLFEHTFGLSIAIKAYLKEREVVQRFLVDGVCGRVLLDPGIVKGLLC